MLNISFARCLGLSPVISTQFTLECVSQPKIGKNSLKPLFYGFRVVQGHRCWYPRKARQQCLYDRHQVCVCLQPFSR